MAVKKPYMGAFEAMEFPPYEFQEFPKQVGYKLDGAGNKVYLVANSKEEEEELKAQAKLDEQIRVNNQTENDVLRAKVEELQAKLAATNAPKVDPVKPLTK